MESFVHLRKSKTPRRLHADLDGLKDDELGRGGFTGRITAWVKAKLAELKAQGRPGQDFAEFGFVVPAPWPTRGGWIPPSIPTNAPREGVIWVILKW